MAFIRATSSSRPPVCTKSPRLRTVVKPARRVRRALTTPRRVLRAGSSWTGTSGLAWSGPPMTRLTSMSMSPGSMVTSPRSIVVASGGTDEGETAADALTLDEQSAGLDQPAPGPVEHPGTDQVDGGPGRGRTCHVSSSRGGSSVVQQVANRFPAGATTVTVAKCREPAGPSEAVNGDGTRRRPPWSPPRAEGESDSHRTARLAAVRGGPARMAVPARLP